jgi:hypothetical protein
VAVKDIHFTETQAALQNALQQRRALEAIVLRATTLITSTTSAGGKFLALAAAGLLLSPASTGLSRVGTAAGSSRFKSPCCGSRAPRLTVRGAERWHFCFVQRRFVITIELYGRT